MTSLAAFATGGSCGAVRRPRVGGGVCGRPMPARAARASARVSMAAGPSPIFGAPRPVPRTILVVGGASALGVEIGRMFQHDGWRVVSLDYFDSSVPACGVNGCALPEDPAAPVSLALPSGASSRMQVRVAEECLKKAGVGKCDVVVNATLGYVTGGISDDDLFETMDYMYHTSVESSLTCAKLAYSFLAPGGMLAMLGSVAGLSPQPKMIGFGACKAAVHQLVRSLALTVGDELPEEAAVLALVPEVLDTPLHRSMNEGQARKHWTPCDAVASKLLQWATDVESRPPNASFVSISSSTEDELVSAGAQHQFRLINSQSFVQSMPL